MKKIITFFLLFMALSIKAEAIKYAQLGGGSGTTCSLGVPCTIDEVFNQISTSEDIVLLAGTETRTTTIDWAGVDGTALDHIEVSCSGGTCLIEGVEHITSWSDQGGNVWRSNTMTNTPISKADGLIGFYWDIAPDVKDQIWMTVEGSCGDLNVVNEICVNTGSKYVEIYSTTDPDTWTPAADFIIPIMNDKLMHIQNVEYLTWDGGGRETTILRGSGNRILEIGTGTTSAGNIDTVTVKNMQIAYGSEGVLFFNADTGSLYTNVLATNVHVHHNTDDSGGSTNGHCVKYGADVAALSIDAIVEDSLVEECIKNGIWVSAGVEQGIARRNRVRSINMDNVGQSAGIGCNGSDLTNCDIIDNVIEGGNNTSGSIGIVLQCNAAGCPGGVDVTGNLITGHNSRGISMFDAPTSSGRFVSANIKGNRILNNNDDGIRVTQTTSLTIANNVLHENNNRGIELGDTTADGVTMNSNLISSNNEVAFECVSGSVVTAEDGNNFYNGGGSNFTDNCSAGIPNTNDTQVEIRQRRIL